MINFSEQDNYYMNRALDLAKQAANENEVPVGCVIVYRDEIIAESYNTKVHDGLATSHAEIKAIEMANRKLGCWMLDEATMYVTLEPCVMCAGAIIQSRIKRVVYATKEPKFGSFGSVVDLSNSLIPFNHHVMIESGLCEEESSKMLKDFFLKLRNK